MEDLLEEILGEDCRESEDKEKVQKGRGRACCSEEGERIAGKEVVDSLNHLVDIFLSLEVQ